MVFIQLKKHKVDHIFFSCSVPSANYLAEVRKFPINHWWFGDYVLNFDS